MLLITCFSHMRSSRQRAILILTKEESSPTCLELIFLATI
uniref:Serine-threonine protein kinase plant-type n=1 Tax=Rhizophora mucronata TaxID=61149 RepID=A0A2P2MWR5_RHIMU